MFWHLDPKRFADIVAQAARAPSMHNSQPWRFRMTSSAIDVILDPQRMLPAGDPTGRAARVACGAAVFNLRLALAVRGTPPTVHLRPDPADDTLIARLTPDHPRPATPVERRLHTAIAHRHSNRHPFRDVPVDASSRAELMAAAEREGAWLHLAESPQDIEATVGLVREADRILRREPEYVAELTAWHRAGSAPDGIPSAAAGPEPDQYELLTRRDFGGGSGGESNAASGIREYEREPLIAVLGASGDLPVDDIVAGVALQRVLLTATDLGLASSMFTQPIDEPSVRERLRLACRRPYPPHVVLRVGYGTAPHRSGRRTADEMITPAARPGP